MQFVCLTWNSDCFKAIFYMINRVIHSKFKMQLPIKLDLADFKYSIYDNIIIFQSLVALLVTIIIFGI